MVRKTAEIKLADGRVRYTTRLEDDIPVTEAPNRQIALLIDLVSNLGVLRCGTSYFQELKMWCDGDRYVVELSATSERALS